MASCPHCGSGEPGSGAFCVHCGKALPDGSRPRIVRERDLASSSAGQDLQSEVLRKKAKTASSTLLVLAVLQFLGCGLLVALGLAFGDDATTLPGDKEKLSGDLLLVMGVILGVLATIFLALGIWARRSPLPPAIIGLTLYVTIILIGALIDPVSLIQGIIVKVIVIAFMIRAIQAGFQHRALLQKMAAA
jgi:hypothetical protein